MDKVYRLWDAFLTGPQCMPMFVAVAILVHLRHELLTADFNNALLTVGTLPDLDIDKCVDHARRMCKMTPASVRRLCVQPRSSTSQEKATLSPPMMGLQMAPLISTDNLLLLKRQAQLLDIRSAEE